MIESSYRHLILDEYQKRKRKNDRYSIRSFSKHLAVSPAFLSLVFRGKRHLSPNAATQIAKNLGWGTSKQKYFLSLLEFENPKSELGVEIAVDQIRKYRASATNRFESVDLEKHIVLSTWYHSAIFTLLTMKKDGLPINRIAKKIGIDTYETELALARLKKLRLADVQNGQWKALKQYLRIDSIPSEAIRSYHKEMLRKAGDALDQQAFNEREFSNLTLTVDPSRLPLLKTKLAEFQDEVAELMEGNKPTEVYQMSFQLFRLSKKGETE